jgi:tRNA-specific 2-thiouridylase
MSRVVLAMSGGVDSSVAAHLLTQQGHDVIGVFMRHGESSPVCSTEQGAKSKKQETSADSVFPAGDPLGGSLLHHKQGCCTAGDAEDARRVADKLGIPFYALNLQEEFGQIIDYFVAEYSAGRTPNPCVQCNNWIKFGKLFEYADSVGAEFVATGHYARLEPRPDGSMALLRGVDAAKDQSYVLFGIRPELLRRMMLPVGSFEKPAIRTMASELGLRVAEKKDSQEICFVTRGRYDEFVRGRRRILEGEVDRGGELVTLSGEVVGRHGGIESFTVGQRKGLGVALGERKFVTRIEPDTRRVVLGDRSEMYRRELTATNANWFGSPPHFGEGSGEGRTLHRPSPSPGPSLQGRGEDHVRCYAQIRYNAGAQPATLTILDRGRFQVAFDEPQFAVTPGQAVVCYDAEDNARVLGGGWID